MTKHITDLIVKIIGKDNNRFYGLLLFIALMFALWALSQRDAPQRVNPNVTPNREAIAGFK
ncbi:MAG: hypothetical protein JWR19_4309 [Pedosphaera sp.]|nr:hypothetical protein [Pedosphaera sp.]